MLGFPELGSQNSKNNQGFQEMQCLKSWNYTVLSKDDQNHPTA